MTQQSLRALSEADYQKYLVLKDSPEKLRKADELLGKIMQLVLADIGIVSAKHSAASSGGRERSAYSHVWGRCEDAS